MPWCRRGLGSRALVSLPPIFWSVPIFSALPASLLTLLKPGAAPPPQPCTKHDAQGLLLPQRSEEPRSWHRRAWLSPAPGSSAGRWKSCLLSSHLWRENGHIIHPNEHLTAKKDLIQVSVYVHTIKLHLELELSQPCVEHLSSPGQSKRPQA